MIPISVAPKRFVAALNKVRFRFPQTILSVRCSSVVDNNSFSTNAATASEYQNNIVSLDPFISRNKILEQVKQEKISLNGPRQRNWWTGKEPTYGICPGVSPDGRIHSLPVLALSGDNLSRQSIQAYFDNTWTLTEGLFAGLQGEAAFHLPPYHDLRHPMIFYYGHPAALYINKLRVAGLLKEPVNPYFEVIFETGVDEMSWDDLSKNRMPWPSVQEVHAYRKQVYSIVSNLISSLSDEEVANVNIGSPLWALAMSFEHERIHLETSSVLITELPIEHVKFPRSIFPDYHVSVPSAAVREPIRGKDYPENRFIEVDAQSVTLGKPRDFPSFGWDNEYGSRTYAVAAFKASEFKVTNGEFHAFIKDGGYSRPELWTDKGWEWRAYRNAKWPSFWVRNGPQGLHHFDLRLIYDVVAMPWDWPVAVNYHEAAAYAKWQALKSGKPIRVMTELEHNAIRDPKNRLDKAEPKSSFEDPVFASSGGSLASTHGINANLSYASPSPVNAFPPNEKGFYDVHGNAWEWTSDYFSALPGFEVHPLYEDFSTPCFDGLHNVIQSSSFISTGNEASVFSRFHFRPHFHQHASFRLVEQVEADLMTADTDAPGPFVGSYPFRRSRAGLEKAAGASGLQQHQGMSQAARLGMHFGAAPAHFNVPALNFIHNLAATIKGAAKSLEIDLATSNVIEVGCGPGGLVFELARSAKTVMGIDHCHEDIELALQLRKGLAVPYSFAREGELSSEAVAKASVAGKEIANAEFRCADPMCLPAELQAFDVVVINDVIDKVSSPNSVLGRLGGVRGLVRPGGLLTVLSAYKWSADTTPRSLWLGGYSANDGGEEVSSVATLQQRLAADFDVLEHRELPMFWQESSVSLRGKMLQMTVFKRKKAD